jgi:TolB-like protein
MLPTRDEAISQLERVLASDLFASTSRLSRFLRFAAERSLAGESERLKEYVIGVEVFDRDEGYDPRVDSIVRVEAGRLRAKLEQYYYGPGRDDAIVIRLQKGGYAPIFEWRLGEAEAPQAAIAPPSAAQAISSTPANATGSRGGVPRTRRTRWLLITAATAAVAIATTVGLSIRRQSPHPANAVAVLPFEPYSSAAEDAMIATQITEGVTAALVRQGSFAVVPSRNARQDGGDGSVQSAARRLRASWLLGGRLEREGSSLHVHVRIVNPERNRKVWVDTFVGSSTDLDELCRRIAVSGAAALQQNAGD